MKLVMKSPRSYEPKNVVQDRLETQRRKNGVQNRTKNQPIFDVG